MIETNPVLTRLWRGDGVEAVHRGAWVLADRHGEVIDGAGDPDQVVYGRSATKSLQALPLIETGAADRFSLPSEALAVALASHSGEPQHVAVVADVLARIGLDDRALRCGPQRPFFAGAEVAERAIVNNCSGKHAGFLAVAQHLGADPVDYIQPDSPVQQLVRDAVAAMTDLEPDELTTTVDGCSAPTFRLPLRRLAMAIARVASPDQLPAERQAACRRLVAAAAVHPELVAGSHDRICTDLLRATNGRLFPKIGAEAIYVVGVVGTGVGLAVKIDDGNQRGFEALLIDILRRHGHLSPDEAAALDRWGTTVRSNRAGLEIGRIELTPTPRPQP